MRFGLSLNIQHSQFHPRMPSSPLRALVCQLGAREHYLVARCFAECGMLAGLATDFWSPLRPAKSGLFRHVPKVVMSAMARYHPDLEGEPVFSAPALAVARYGIGLFDKKGQYEGMVTRQFARRLRELRIPHNVFFGYSYDSLEILQEERKNGVFTILCQTDPGAAHYKMLVQEADRWPEYGMASASRWTEARERRLREEWDLASVIVVNSEWTKNCIVQEGADPGKIEILPLAYAVEGGGGVSEAGGRRPESETSGLSPVPCSLSPAGGRWAVGGEMREDRGRRSDPSDAATLTADRRSPISAKLRVLWLGNVSLGKGIQYLVEAARLLVDEPVEFVVGGTLHISASVIRDAPRNIRWIGRIPRSQTSEWYGKADVFVFPTLSDGFGITQLEAMCAGVPVIATPNCGRVVEDGVNGFIVPARDARALASAIYRFIQNPQLAKEMAPACLETVKAFSVPVYARRLLEIIAEQE